MSDGKSNEVRYKNIHTCTNYIVVINVAASKSAGDGESNEVGNKDDVGNEDDVGSSDDVGSGDDVGNGTPVHLVCPLVTIPPTGR